MAGTAIRIALVVTGVLCIGIFLWTLTDPDIPKIWIGGIFVGIYLIYKGATYRPKKTSREPSFGRDYQKSLRRGDYADASAGGSPRPAAVRGTRSRHASGLGMKAARECVKCGEPIEQEWLACPSCGADYREVCRYCGQRIESKWIACPYCSSEF